MDVRRLRRRLGLSQRGLAELLGSHAMTVSKWERGVLQPGPRHERLLLAFAQAANRGARFEAGREPADPVRFLAELLGQAYRATPAGPDVDLGALSASNVLPGRIVDLARGDVMCKLVIEVAPGIRIGSVITRDSVERLGLGVGSPAVAIIKATEVIVGKG
jgi:molybdopterin-binding protein